MQRYKLTLQYNGAPYSGWATRQQALLPSVCSVIEDAIGKLCGARFSLGVASQTDRGVHALANVAQVDILRSINKKKKPPAAGDEKAPPFLEFELQNGLNYHLKEHPIVVTRVDLVDQEWDARSSAVGRSYLYRLVTGGDTRTSLVFERDTSWHCRGSLDLEAMQRVCRVFQGTHDFSCFGKNGDTYTKVPMRTIDLADVVEVPASAYANPSDQYRFYHVSIKSRAFMYHQVRYMVGALVRVGQGEWNEADIRRMLEVDPQRTPFPPANLLAPAHGLFLRGVDYGGADTAVARQYWTIRFLILRQFPRSGGQPFRRVPGLILASTNGDEQNSGPEEDFDITSPRQPLTLVCVDGSEESDRALRWAMRNLPDKHGLMLIHGVKIPYSASLEIHPHKAEDMREHDRLVQRYRRICQENGRRCGMAHFHYQRGDAFGDGVCSYARLRGAQAVVTGRRTNISNARRAVFGSGSQYVLQHCEDIPVTVVSTEEQSD